MDACIWGQVEVVKVLLDRGADVNVSAMVRTVLDIYVLSHGCGVVVL